MGAEDPERQQAELKPGALRDTDSAYIPHTVEHVHTAAWTDRRTDGQTDEWKDELTGGRASGRVDTAE